MKIVATVIGSICILIGLGCVAGCVVAFWNSLLSYPAVMFLALPIVGAVAFPWIGVSMILTWWREPSLPEV